LYFLSAHAALNQILLGDAKSMKLAVNAPMLVASLILEIDAYALDLVADGARQLGSFGFWLVNSVNIIFL
jgi:hypothetical protein